MKSAQNTRARSSQDANSVFAMSPISAALADWCKTEGHRWLFVVKILMIVFVTLWLAYRLELSAPATAITTVFLLALPSSGMVLEKAFFRLIGTLVGCTASVIMVALLPQAMPLLFVCVAIWIGLCTCGAAMFRNFKSYGFLLSGYTVCIIVIPAVAAPGEIFTLAITRVTEVTLAILCSAFISDALFPHHQSDLVMQTVTGRYDRFVALCRDTLENKLAPAEAELMHLHFAADIALLETTRAAAFFEATHTYSESRHLNLFNTASMEALTTFYTLHRLLHRMRQNSSVMVADLTEALCRYFLSALDANPAPAGAQATRLYIKTHGERLRKEMIDGEITSTERIGLDTIIELLERFAKNIYDLQVVYFALAQKKRLPYRAFHSYAPRTPFPIVLASGLRASIAVLILAAVWYYLDWPNAGMAMLIAVIFTAFATASPSPPKTVHQIVIGFVIGVLAAFICNFFLMVHAEGFPMLVLCIAPFAMLGIYLTTIPKYASVGLGLNIFLTLTIIPENGARMDATGFINNVVALVLGASLAWVVHSLVFPRHTMGQKDYIAGALWREALRTCTSARIESPQRFGNRFRDLLNQLHTAAGPTPDAETRAVVGRALTLLELGHAVINMREVIATAPATDIRMALQDCVARVAAFLRAPTARHRSDLMDAVIETGRLVREARLSAAPERVARLNLALADLHCLYTLMLDHEQLMQTSVQTTMQIPEGDHRVA